MPQTTLQSAPTVQGLCPADPQPIRSAFVAWLKSRLAQGESNAAIGRSLGVTHEAVRGWVSGKINPSNTVLLLADRLMREPRELSAGLGG